MKFKPRDYQADLVINFMLEKYKRFLCIWHRRAGKDIVAFSLMARYAIKYPGVYYYVFPTYSQARRVIWNGMSNDGQRFLDFIPDNKIKKTNEQQMIITFHNGSQIQLVGSDDYDRLMGTNPKGLVLSEYALQDPRAYQYLRPILVANDGWAMFISCVMPETLVITKDGIRQIQDVSSLRTTYSELHEPIYGLGGFHTAEQFYYGGRQKTLKITLSCGYQIECTPIHPLWNGSTWIKAQDLNVGDMLPIQYGQEVFDGGIDLSEVLPTQHAGNKKLKIPITSLDFLYVLGLIHADGNYDTNKVCITNKKDPEIIEFLHNYGFKTRADGIHHEYNNRYLCQLLEYMGFKHGALNKTFPKILFECTKEELVAFLQGIFDGDGTSASRPSARGTVKYTSVCKEFMQTLQIVLLNFGIVSSIRKEEKKPTKKVNSYTTLYNLEIRGHFAHVFYTVIGFRLQRKQKNHQYVPHSCRSESGNIYPIDTNKLKGYSLPKNIITNPSKMSRRTLQKLHRKKPHPYLEELLKEKFFYSPIVTIEESANDVFDFVIPETHSFFSNGFISHNTPRSKNHLYTLYQIAKDNPQDWFCQRLTVNDTNVVSQETLDKELKEGIMSADMIQQEYYCSFDAGASGAYYSKYIDNLRLKEQITDVPWQPSLPVHTAWDIGIRDSTTIIFFQSVSGSIRVIDCYENHKEGLEHYINYLQQQPYTYGTHIGPHDIRVNEFGSGMTRWEKARQLGITFTVAPQLSLEDGIEAVRTTLPRCYFDQTKAKPLINALENYRQEWDARLKIYKPRPLHDHNSHFADSFRYLAVSEPKTRDGMTQEDADKIRNEALYGTHHHNQHWPL